MLTVLDRRFRELACARVREGRAASRFVRPDASLTNAAILLKVLLNRAVGGRSRVEDLETVLRLVIRDWGGRDEFDLLPFLYGMPELGFWDERRTLFPELPGVSFVGSERVRREVEIQLSGTLRLCQQAGDWLTIHDLGEPQLVGSDSQHALTIAGSESSGFVSLYSYHPVVPQLLRDSAAALRQGILEPGNSTGRANNLSDFPKYVALSLGGCRREIAVPVVDSKVLPRLVPISGELRIDPDKVGLQAAGLRSDIRSLVSDWATSEAVRRKIIDSADEVSRRTSGSTVVPEVTVVVATKRPSFLSRAIANFCRQSYPRKQLVLVCHGFPAAQARWVLHEAGVDAAVIEQSSSVHLGRCLNVGVAEAQGDVWMKMDDDDIYGPEYVYSNVGLLLATRADVLARPLLLARDNTGWTFDEHKAARCNVFVEDDDPSGHMCGATLTGWCRSDRFNGFDEGLARAVDSEFLRRSRTAGMRLVSVNVPGYACVRYASPDHHTWGDWRPSGTRVTECQARDWLGMKEMRVEGIL